MTNLTSSTLTTTNIDKLNTETLNSETSNIKTPIVILLTHSPSHPNTKKALEFTQVIYKKIAECSENQPQYLNIENIKIFLYSDAVVLANRLIWLPEDMENIAKKWQQLAVDYQVPIQVCVSAALARGVTDTDNAVRHGLQGENLAAGFELVGLGELAMHLHSAQSVYQF